MQLNNANQIYNEATGPILQKAGKHNGSVGTALERQIKELDALESTINELATRLAVVMRDEPMMAMENNPNERPPCALACGIDEQTNRIAILRQGVASMIHRLEL